MERVNILVKNYLSPALKCLGFKKQGHRWKRERDCFVDVIEVVVLRGSTSEEERCDLKYGVSIPKFYYLIWNDKQKSFPYEADCIFRSSLVKFVTLTSNDDVEAAGEMLCEYVNNKIISTFDSFTGFQMIQEYLVNSKVMERSYPLDRIYYALTEIELGNTESCISILNGIRFEKNRGWSTRAKNVLENIKVEQDKHA